MILGFGIGIGFPQAIGGFVGALDGLTASAAAYSTRRLLTAYTGPLIRVRRSSDNAEADIGFTASGDLDTTALLAHVGAGDGFVTTWYDQSGNTRDVTQATGDHQPMIVNAGAVETMGGRPSPVFDGVNDILTRDAAFGLYAAGAITTCAVLQAPGQIDRRIWAEGSSLSGFPIYAPIQSLNSGGGVDSSAFIRNDAGGVLLVAPILTTNAFNDTAHVLTHVDTGSALSGFLDGAAGSTVAYTRSGAMTLNRFAVGGLLRSVPISHLSGRMPEVVIVASALSTADRETLEANQMTYYGITP